MLRSEVISYYDQGGTHEGGEQSKISECQLRKEERLFLPVTLAVALERVKLSPNLGKFRRSHRAVEGPG